MTRGLENTLRGMQRHIENDKSYICNDDAASLYNVFLTVDISNQSDILCPLYCMRHVLRVLTHINGNNLETKRIVIPINIENYIYREFKTVDSAIKFVFDRYDNALGAFKGVFKGEVFYGYKNLLLNEHFSIMFMPCIKLDFTNKVFKDYIVVTDYSMLNNPVNAISKAIIKKIIPYYTLDIIHYEAQEMGISKTPSILFTDLRRSNILINTEIVDIPPYDILHSEMGNLINSLDYVS